MTKYVINGGKPLHGEIEISGAKNAAVAIIPAALMVDGVCRIENLPQISDVTTLLRILKEMGADLVVDPEKEPDVAGTLKDFFGTGELADVAFECAGTKQSLYNCLEYATRPGGQVMMVGQVTEPIDNIVPSDSFVKELDLQFSFVFTARDVEIYIDMLVQGKLGFPGMVTGVIPLADCVEKGLGLEREERRKHIKILIDPGAGL